MDKKEAKILIRDLINKIYNETDITDEILEEIEKDLEEIATLLKETSISRELGVFINSAREQKSQIGKNSFKYLILSNLEKRYQGLLRVEEKVSN